MKLINISIDKYFHMIPLWKSPIKLPLWSYPWSCGPGPPLWTPAVALDKPQVHISTTRPINKLNFYVFCLIFLFLDFFLSFLYQNHVFWTLRRKTIQNHGEITSESQFWTRSVSN